MIKWLVLGVLSVGATLLGLNSAYRLLREPSDFLVFLGVALILALVVTWIAIGRKVGRRVIEKMTVLLVVALASTACGYTRISPGHVGIVVNSWGTDRGVDSYPATTGAVAYNPFTTSVLEYPTFMQTAVWSQNKDEGHPTNEEITFSTKDQMRVSADISLGYTLDPSKVPAFYVKFRNDDLDGFTHGFMRNLAREKFDNIAGKYSIEQIMGDNGPFLAEVRKDLQASVDVYGVKIEQFGFVGVPRPPQAVIDSINAKVQAVQSAIKVENQLRETQAEAQKNIAQAEGDSRSKLIRAEADAKANRVVADSLTPTLVEWMKVQKWNGVQPTVVSGGTGLIFSMPK